MSLPTNNPHHKRSKLQERKGAKQYDGRQNSGSGNGWIHKADVRTDDELIEFKTTTKGSYSVRSSDLQKLWTQALLADKRGVLEIEFANDGTTCVVLDKNDYLELR